jgi:all-trans-8'-apo-beta-carotenal 15,15'-oxygenase
MTTATRTPTLAPWHKLFQSRIQEFPLTPLPTISGALPVALQGSLYRNGPALFERRGERLAHWFDGDGAILAIHLAAGQATATYRMVNTAGYQAESQRDQFIYSGYRRQTSLPLWRKDVSKNAANTSVLALPDRLLALWEGGFPHALDPQDLTTRGLDNLQGLRAPQSFSAHPKVDAASGEIYNFGLTFGRQTRLHLYRCDRLGQLQQQRAIELDYIPLIHDFVVAGPYILFCLSPVGLNPWPVLLRQQGYSDALSWQPERGTQILVFDRASLELVSRGEAEPWFQWHFANGYLDGDGQLQVDVVRYADFQTNQFLQEVPGGNPQTPAPGHLWRLSIDPQRAEVKSAQLSDRSSEFPTIDPRQVGTAHSHIYAATRSDRAAVTDLFDALSCYHCATSELTINNLGGGRYPSEPLLLPDPQRSGGGWVAAVIYDASLGQSELWLWPSDRLGDEPCCRLALTQPIALGFHGTWCPR